MRAPRNIVRSMHIPPVPDISSDPIKGRSEPREFWSMYDSLAAAVEKCRQSIA